MSHIPPPPGGLPPLPGGFPSFVGGTDASERLDGSSGPDVMFGVGGNDRMFGYGGVDVLDGAIGNDQLFGGAGKDRLFGAAGADILNGGTGLDELRGGFGNDIYFVDRAGEAIEVAGQGIDTVRSTISYTLGANLEKLVLLGTAGLFGIGNGLANAITGNSGANRLNGGGGNDVLTGLGGNDVFVFRTALNATSNVDRITDMNERGNDTIALDNAVFAALGGTGALAASAFRANATGLAQDRSDRIILERDTGELYYDSNGSAEGGRHSLFARVDAGITLTSADFLVI